MNPLRTVFYIFVLLMAVVALDGIWFGIIDPQIVWKITASLAVIGVILFVLMSMGRRDNKEGD